MVELNAEDLARINKLRSDAICVFISEIILWTIVFITIGADEQPEEINKYLLVLGIVNSVFGILKFLLVYVMAYTRRAGRTEWYQIGC